MTAWAIIVAAVLFAVRMWGVGLIKAVLPTAYYAQTVQAITVVLIVAIALVIDRLIRLFYWRGHLKRRRNRETPALIQDIVTVLLVLIGLSIGLWEEAGLTVTGIVTASGATAFVLGIALQNVIQDLFSGLSINFDGSYSLGDWLTIYSDQLDQPVYGCVTGITWRTTFLTLESGRRLMIPNRMIGANPVMNHSRPHEAKMLTVEVTVDIRVPPDRVVDMLLGEAFKAVRQSGLARFPEPVVILNRLTSDAGIYEVRFYAYPNQITPGPAQSIVLRALQEVILQNQVPMPVTQVEMTEPPNLNYTLGEKEVRDAICQVTLFRHALDTGQVDAIVKRCKPVELPRGAALMHQGDAASSMFIILEGAASVSARGVSGEAREVAISATGDVAGEMSLLTGAPRTATVTALTRLRVLEITKEPIEELLKKSPELLERFSQVLAKRQHELDEIANRSSERAAIETDLLARMKTFFSRVFGADEKAKRQAPSRPLPDPSRSP